MGLFDKFGKGKLRKQQMAELNSTLWRIVADGQVTDDELEEINRYFYDSELTTEEIQRAQAEVFTQLLYQAISDRRVTIEEFRILDHIAMRFSLAPEVRRQMYEQIQYYRLFNVIESGGELPRTVPGNVILQKGEECYVSAPATLFEERVIRGTYQGGSHGVSIRVMKGVSYRVGAHRGHIQAERCLVAISEGSFSVTNQRLIFSGDRKSAAIPYTKLLDLQVYADALQFSVSNRQKPVLVGFSAGENAELCALVISRLINT